MTEFEKNFLSLAKLLEEKQIHDYSELIDLMKEQLTPKIEESKGKSIILLGYSGNGKSTWIKKFCERNPTYQGISWDGEVLRKLNGRNYSDVPYDEILKIFGTALEKCIKEGHDIVLDGNYLNLPLRVALINTLHQYNYETSLVDLTPLIDEILQYRIKDEVRKYQSHPRFANVPYEKLVSDLTTYILSFKKNEEVRSSFPLQIEYGVVDLGADKYFDHTVPMQKIANSETKQKK